MTLQWAIIHSFFQDIFHSKKLIWVTIQTQQCKKYMSFNNNRFSFYAIKSVQFRHGWAVSNKICFTPWTSEGKWRDDLLFHQVVEMSFLFQLQAKLKSHQGWTNYWFRFNCICINFLFTYKFYAVTTIYNAFTFLCIHKTETFILAYLKIHVFQRRDVKKWRLKLWMDHEFKYLEWIKFTSFNILSWRNSIVNHHILCVHN